MNQKLPPHDIDAEESVIGSLLLEGDYMVKIVNVLRTNDFYDEKTKYFYAAANELYSRREKINEITLAQELQRTEKLQVIGGVAEIKHLISKCPTPLDIEYYAAIVRRLSVNRQLISVGDKLSSVGYQADPDVNKTLDTVFQVVSDFRMQNTTIEKLITPTDVGNQVLSLIEHYNQPDHAISWGYYDLDNITSGLYGGEFIVVGSRPGVGKTQIMFDVAESIVGSGRIVLFASAEMSMNQLLERKVARELKVGIRQMRAKGLDNDEMDKVVNLAGVMSERKIYYLPQGVSGNEIYAEARKMQEKIGLDVIFVDYIQFLRECWGERENQNVRVGRVCKLLKTMAMELGVPVVAASQLSRALELRSEESRRPTLADLRDSGNIEQDADVVLLLHRDPDNESILEVKMAKNRQLGSAPAIKLQWKEDSHRYVEYKDGQYPL